MSSEIVSRIGSIATETAVATAWAQWSTVNAAAVPVGDRSVWTIIDPEALLLVSLALRAHERRLADLIAGWVRQNSSLLSVQRLNTLKSFYPSTARDGMGFIAVHAFAGGDRRWLRYAQTEAAEPVVGKSPGPPRLIEAPTLLLRLRAGVGVGAKADILAFLLGARAAADLQVLSTATAYTPRAVRTAAADMALARFIHEIDGRPVTYRADVRAWAQLLESRRLDPADSGWRVPPWHFWSVAFECLTSLIEWSDDAMSQGWSAYVASTYARDLLDARRRRLRFLPIPVPESSDARGAEFLPHLERFTNDLLRWCHTSLVGENAII